MSFQNSERVVDGAAIRNKTNGAINLPHRLRRLMRGTTSPYQKQRLIYDYGKDASTETKAK